MLDITFIRKNLKLTKRKVEEKGVSFNDKEFNKIDSQRRELITNSENIKNKKNKLAKEIGQLKREKANTKELESQSKAFSAELAALESELQKVENSFQDFMLNVPNLFDDSIPVGKNEKDNLVVREWGKKPEFNFTPKPHWELGEANGSLDFSRASKISGARFALYFDKLAKLERVLINLMLDTHTQENGYTEVLPPFLVKDESLIGTGNLPKFKEDLFKVEDHNLYLIPTAEVPLTNIHRDEILNEEILPKHYVAYTPCFRSEAGSYGKDMKGIIRHHQFNKVELLKFTTPQHSYEELEKLTQDAEKILQKLNLHYRVVLLCTGDMSFSSAKTYDLEVWMPARNGYLEISSCSNFTDFQARRAKIKYKTKEGKKNFLHTLNGSGLAVGRTVAAIMENYQSQDCKIEIPEILRTYFPKGTLFIMPFYNCTFIDDNGHFNKRTLFADSKNSLRESFLNSDEKLLYIKRNFIKDASSKDILSKRVGYFEFLLFNQKIITLLKSGVSFIRALEIVINNTKKGNLREILSKCESDIKNGVQISDAFASEQIPFQKIYRASLLAGERSGNLESILERFNVYLDKVAKMKRKIISSMFYPSILFIFMIGMVLLILVYAIPKFTLFYKDFESDLPDVTLKLIALGNFLKDNAINILLILLAIWVILKLIEKIYVNIIIFDYVKIKIPFIGKITIDNAMAVFSRTLAILIGGGIPVPEASQIAVETFTNRYFYSNIKDIPEKIKEGNLLSDALNEVSFIPNILVEVIRVGESSGNLVDVLNDNADAFENSIDARISSLISLIEPILIVIMGFVIAFMLIAVYLPIFNTVNVVR